MSEEVDALILQIVSGLKQLHHDISVKWLTKDLHELVALVRKESRRP